MNRTAIVSVSLVVAILLVLLWLSRDRLMPGASEPAPATTSAPSSSGGPTASLFTARVIGNPPRGEERPQIAHVAISDLDRDGLNDVLVCDSFRNIVTWIRQAPLGTFTETTIAGEVREQYEFGGIGAQTGGGVDVRLGRYVSGIADYKFTFARPRIDVAGGTGRTTSKTHHFAFGIALGLPE